MLEEDANLVGQLLIVSNCVEINIDESLSCGFDCLPHGDTLKECFTECGMMEFPIEELFLGGSMLHKDSVSLELQDDVFPQFVVQLLTSVF